MEDLKWVDQCIYEIELDINRRMFDILYTTIGATGRPSGVCNLDKYPKPVSRSHFNCLALDGKLVTHDNHIDCHCAI